VQVRATTAPALAALCSGLQAAPALTTATAPPLAPQDGRQINANDPDDKMGGLDYLRLDKTKDKSYAFDHAFDETAAQENIFDATTANLIPDVMRGSNATCFAYGATGSGKTHTMMGTPELPGVIPLTVDELFAHIRDAAEDYQVGVNMQYVEIYNESIKDLLEPARNQNLDVRESPKDGTYVSGAASTAVSSRKELEALSELRAQDPNPRKTDGLMCTRGEPLGATLRRTGRTMPALGVGIAHTHAPIWAALQVSSHSLV
jgi:hypothetical protein